MHILLLEDSPVVSKMLATQLVKLGHKVDAVENGQQGFHRATSRHYHLVITDLAMPHWDGFKFMEAMLVISPQCPIVAISSSLDEQTIRQRLDRFANVIGFLPVSQLNTEHYPRVEGGDKSKILSALKRFIGQNFRVKVIDINENEKKLILSEKSAWEKKQQAALNNFKVGDVIEGKVTAVVDFGAFVEFGNNLEGLVHISELAWQRIDNPKQIVKVGDKIKAEIISMDGSRVSLSIKKLVEDPWKNVAEKYKIGQKVKGKVLKINLFGAFVELDKDIHGLIHISELSDKPIATPTEVIKEGEIYDFAIITIEPTEHRLGLSLKSAKAKPVVEKEVKADKEKATAAENTETEETKKIEDTKKEKEAKKAIAEKSE